MAKDFDTIDRLIGNAPPSKRTNKQIVRNLFPHTAVQPERKIPLEQLVVQNPVQHHAVPYRDPLGRQRDLIEEEEQEFIPMKTPFQIAQEKLEAESDRPFTPDEDSDDEGFDIRKAGRALQNKIPETDKTPVLTTGKRKSLKNQYTPAELAELGLDKE